MKTIVYKTPCSKLDYSVDITDMIGERELADEDGFTVTSSDPDVLIVDNEAQADGIVTFDLEGGVLGRRYVVSVAVETVDGYKDCRDLIVEIVRQYLQAV